MCETASPDVQHATSNIRRSRSQRQARQYASLGEGRTMASNTPPKETASLSASSTSAYLERSRRSLVHCNGKMHWNWRYMRSVETCRIFDLWWWQRALGWAAYGHSAGGLDRNVICSEPEIVDGGSTLTAECLL